VVDVAPVRGAAAAGGGAGPVPDLDQVPQRAGEPVAGGLPGVAAVAVREPGEPEPGEPGRCRAGRIPGRPGAWRRRGRWPGRPCRSGSGTTGPAPAAARRPARSRQVQASTGPASSANPARAQQIQRTARGEPRRRRPGSRCVNPAGTGRARPLAARLAAGRLADWRAGHRRLRAVSGRVALLSLIIEDRYDNLARVFD